VEYGACVDMTNHQESTPLHCALYKRHAHCAMFLLHSGADVDLLDKVTSVILSTNLQGRDASSSHGRDNQASTLIV
jgi:ankyrin repeat protein